MTAKCLRYIVSGILLLFLFSFASCGGEKGSSEDQVIGIWKDQEYGDLLILMENHTGLYRTFDSECDLVWTIEGEELVYTKWDASLRKTIKRPFSIKKDILTLTDKRNYDDIVYDRVADAPVPGEPIGCITERFVNPYGCVIKFHFYDNDEISVFPPVLQGAFSIYSYNGDLVFQGETTATKDDFDDCIIDSLVFYRSVSFFIPTEEILCDIDEIAELDYSLVVSDETLRMINGKRIGPYSISYEYQEQVFYADWRDDNGSDSVILHSTLPMSSSVAETNDVVPYNYEESLYTDDRDDDSGTVSDGVKSVELKYYSVDLPVDWMERVYVSIDEADKSISFNEKKNYDADYGGFLSYICLMLKAEEEEYGYEHIVLGTLTSPNGNISYLIVADLPGDIPYDLSNSSLKTAYLSAQDGLESVYASIKGINGWKYAPG